MDRDEGEVHKRAKKNLEQYFPNTDLTLSQ